jgi:hypothetical protein
VRLVSPVHAEVTATTTAPGLLPARQEWWVVLQEEGPRIRTISVAQPSAADLAPASRPAALLNAA